ncbi:MAG: phosphoribosylformylglycinamidine synthase subunit PurS [Candidatus Syntrophonatronum acetioxidans]|uniref:Phosphoribosylformylglycinamidine synthase subunit PurS n=1 Tax=Candidatus Syntrophonatronum acetioxidans TaxID=1795816 RepID=A0A424YD46_9FIRM|nr:MAG: phosphoribosylformylglycinamidine synthase subunit PurS [Candidatus Syntrophonatronum acetioxidans]
MWKAKIQVTLKKSVLDPQGVAVEKALKTLNYNNVGDVRVGKYLEVSVEGNDREEVESQIREMCDKLLTNPVIEDYTFEVTEV